MRNLLNFLLKFHVFIVFLLLEIICVLLIMHFNNFQRVKFLNSCNSISGSVYSKYQNANMYFDLRKQNDELAVENTQLRNKLQRLVAVDKVTESSSQLADQTIFYIPAKIIKNSTSKELNYITIDKGRVHGIHVDMGVVGPDGIVGVVVNVSDHFATVLSILNTRWTVSARIKKNNFFGPLNWDGVDYRISMLNEMPFHVDVQEGDTIVTSGHSSIFPEGLMIGTVGKVDNAVDKNFLKIWVNLSTNYRNIYYVNCIRNVLKTERDNLEHKTDNVQ